VKRSYFVWALLFLVLLFDQWLKIWVKLNMAMGESFDVLGLSWFKIYFTENPGMAFGMELGGSYGKLALSLFRVVAVFFIAYYLFTLVKKNSSWGLLASITLILAGAMGNILDSMFYGLIFTESGTHIPAKMTEFGDGYASFLHGRVVDMLYFPLIEKPFRFFQPIFNIADASISVGVAMLIIFYRRFFPEIENKEVKTTDDSEQFINTFAADDKPIATDDNLENKSNQTA
jgi:signal peptidase II